MKLTVHVKPQSSQEKIVENADESLTVFLHAGAHDGEANLALVKVLAKYFGVAKGRVRILRGEKGREKVIEIF